MDLDATPTRQKRAHDVDDEPVATPTPFKKQRLEDTAADTASAISDVFGYGQKTQPPAGGDAPSGDATPQPSPSKPSPAPASASASRPSIKLKALRGTKWDTGAPRPPSLPKKVAPALPPPKPKAPTLPAKRRGRKPKAQAVTDQPVTDQPVTDGSVSEASAHIPAQAPAEPQPVASSPQKPTPKGILTPAKKRGRPPGRKNVTFGTAPGPGGEVFFEDLPNKPKGKQAPAADEIVCEICSRPDSKAPNQIILCDNCDFAVHQECYEVPEIPEGDWLCKSCAQEDVLKAPNKADDMVADTTAHPTAEAPEIPNLEKHVRSLQRVLLDRCTGRRRIRMSGQEDAYEKVHQLVEQTVVAGEGNSMLLIGARGCGKTTLLEGIIQDLSKFHGQDFHVVRLNGFIHTDDKLALKDIWRQLGKEMNVEDDLMSRTNYADTMASLLALLSHPSEILGTDSGVTSQSIVFIIDEFDMFASHPRQTLLYNLFDIAQSRKAPIAVIGCTTRLDVVEMLEKRVKSRFSHRYVYLSQPKSLPAYWQVCKQGLVVERNEAGKEGIDTSLEGHDEFHNYWNHKIEALYKERSFQDVLQYHYYTTKSAPAFLTEWILPLSSLTGKDVRLAMPPARGDVDSLSGPDSSLHLMSTLSELDIGLLIAAARLDIVAHTDTVNLAMAYDEYSSLMGRQRVQSATSGMLAVGGGVRVWSRGVAGIAWERLISLGFLVPAGIGGGRALGHSGLEGRMWKVDVALEEIPSAVKLNTVLAKWCREL